MHQDDDYHEVQIARDVVYIQGGYLPGGVGNPPHKSWVAQTLKRDGAEYAVADKANPKFVQFVSSEFKMLEHLIAERNRSVNSLIQTKEQQARSGQDDDPMADERSAQPAKKRRRAEIMDELPETLEVTVTVPGQLHRVKILSSWHGRPAQAWHRAQRRELAVARKLTGRGGP